MHLYLVRHGESEANAAEMVQGYEPPLTERGREQARFVAERFKTIPVDAIYASPMPRAKETAEIINSIIQKPLEFDDVFMETREPSELLGKSDNDPVVRESRKLRRENFADLSFRQSDEENFVDMKERGMRALKQIESAGVERLLVVSHGALIRILVALMMFGEALEPQELLRMRRFLFSTNTGITWCEFDYPRAPGRWALHTWMDHAHLGEVR